MWPQWTTRGAVPSHCNSSPDGARFSRVTSASPNGRAASGYCLFVGPQRVDVGETRHGAASPSLAAPMPGLYRGLTMDVTWIALAAV